MEDLRKIDFDRKGKPVRHGTLNAYKWAYCRCIGCVDNYRRYHRDLDRRLKAERGQMMMVEWEKYGHLLTKHLERGVLPVRIAERSGLAPYTVLRMIRTKCTIRPDSYKRLQSLPEELPAGRMSVAEKLNAPAPKHPKTFGGKRNEFATKLEAEREKRRRFQSIFKYFWSGGFTKETLAERLGIDEEGLRRFIDSDYEDKMLGMRICQLHHIMRLGE